MLGIPPKLVAVTQLSARHGKMLTHFGDILLNPFQELSLIKQAIIQVAILTNLFTGKEPQGPHAIVEVHEYNAVS